jgi:hypothetical protein
LLASTNSESPAKEKPSLLTDSAWAISTGSVVDEFRRSDKVDGVDVWGCGAELGSQMTKLAGQPIVMVMTSTADMIPQSIAFSLLKHPKDDNLYGSKKRHSATPK